MHIRYWLSRLNVLEARKRAIEPLLHIFQSRAAINGNVVRVKHRFAFICDGLAETLAVEIPWCFSGIVWADRGKLR